MGNETETYSPRSSDSDLSGRNSFWVAFPRHPWQCRSHDTSPSLGHSMHHCQLKIHQRRVGAHRLTCQQTLNLMAAQAPSQGAGPGRTFSTTLLAAMAVRRPSTFGPSRTLSTGLTVLISAPTHAPPSIRSSHGPGETMSETLGPTVAHAPPSIHSRTL